MLFPIPPPPQKKYRKKITIHYFLFGCSSTSDATLSGDTQRNIILCPHVAYSLPALVYTMNPRSAYKLRVCRREPRRFYKHHDVVLDVSGGHT